MSKTDTAEKLWRPMDEAPRDGTIIEAFVYGHIGPVKIAWVGAVEREGVELKIDAWLVAGHSFWSVAPSEPLSWRPCEPIEEPAS